MSADRTQVVIPMAGRGSRFAAVGYEEPKPFIPVFDGVWMIEVVLSNLMPSDRSTDLILVCQREHLKHYDVASRLGRFADSLSVVELDGVTEGAACTVLAAASALDADRPLMIANSDQYLDADVAAYLDSVAGSSAGGTMMTMSADDPKWSFVARAADGTVERVVEKEVVSTEATVGVYNFRRAGYFTEAAKAMIDAKDAVNGEYYVAPTYTYLIRGGMTVDAISIGDVSRTMWGLGTPEDLDLFLANREVAERAHEQLRAWW